MESRRPAHIAIVGTGLGGITTAIALKKRGFTNFTIYERASDVGGTWRDNTYPGCASDAPVHWYSHSDEMNANWTSPYGTQPELQAYWKKIFFKYSLEQHTQFNTSVESAAWNNELQRYTIYLKANEIITKREVEALVWAIGGFKGPKYPENLQGLENFQGLKWHSSQWRHDVDLKGKRVGVVGNGCSGAQIVPKIAADPSVEVVNFVRTPQWYVEKEDKPFSTTAKWAFAKLPFVLRWYRNWIWFTNDINYYLGFNLNSPTLPIARRRLHNYLKTNAPAEELKNLTPQYPPGCKRIIVDPGYLASLHRPNVSLKWDRIESYVENGVQLQNGEVVPLDIIAFSTGYVVHARNIHVTGRTGETLNEYLDRHGGGHSYLGTQFPGFPNMFIMLGPNVATGHASVVFAEETQANLILECLIPVIEGKAKSLEVTQAATDRYNDWIQSRLKNTVWTQCFSYYNDGKDGKNSTTFPGPTTLFWWKAVTRPWSDYRAMDGEKWESERQSIRITTFLTSFVVALCATYGLYRL